MVTGSIARAGPAVDQAVNPKAVLEGAVGEAGSNPFDAMLGVALAQATGGGAPAVPIAPAVKGAEPMLLEVLLDGEWTLELPSADQGTSSTPSTAGFAAGAGGLPFRTPKIAPSGKRAEPARSEPEPTSKPTPEQAAESEVPSIDPATTVELGLDEWIGALAGHDGKPTGPKPDGAHGQLAFKPDHPVKATEPTDPVALPLALSLSVIGVESVAAASVWSQGSAIDRPNPEKDRRVVPDADPPQPDPRPNIAPPPPERLAVPLIVPDEGGTDGEALITRLAPFHRAIEIGGFTFPSGIEPHPPATDSPAAGIPTVQPKAPDAADRPPPPIRIEPPPLSGGLDFGSDTSSSSDDPSRGSGTQSSSDQRPPRLPAISPPPQTESRLSDLLIRARREASGSNRTAPPSKAAALPEKDPEPAHPPLPESKPTTAAPAMSPATAPTSSKRTEQPANAPNVKPTVLEAPTAAPRRTDHVLVDLKDDFGDHGKLRLALSGSTVRATIIPNDPDLADRLTAGMRELRQTLEAKGFAEPRLTIQPPPPQASKSDGPATGHLFGREVVTEVPSLVPKGESQAAGDDDPRRRWQADQSSRQPREQRQQSQQQQRESREEGQAE